MARDAGAGVRAGQGARDHERMDDATLRARVREALDDPNRAIPADRVFAELRAHHEARVKAERPAGA
jgi:antitoxin ParD1/3/4